MFRFFVFLLIFGFGLTAQAAAPLSFTFQGQLLEDGSPVNDERTFTATILDQHKHTITSSTKEIPVKAGRYSMTIDNIDAGMVAASDGLFLEIEVDNTKLAPVLPINSVPYAISSRQADLAKDISCDGCIKPEHLNFVPNTEGFEIPACATNQIMRAQGNKWVCTDAVTVDDTRTEFALTQISGNIGINAHDGYGQVGISQYVKDTETSSPDGLQSCPCDNDPTNYDCDDSGFSSYEFSRPQCYDQAAFGGDTLYHYYKLSPAGAAGAIDNLVVVKDGQVGIGTGAPQAQMHLRSNNEPGQPNVIIDSPQPEIRLTAPNGTSYSIIATNEGLAFVNNSSGKKVVISDGYLNADREISNWKAREGNIKAQGTFTTSYTNCNCTTGAQSGCAQWTCSEKISGNLTNAINATVASSSTTAVQISFPTPIINPKSTIGNVNSNSLTINMKSLTTSGSYSPSGRASTYTFTVYGED